MAMTLTYKKFAQQSELPLSDLRPCSRQTNFLLKKTAYQVNGTINC